MQIIEVGKLFPGPVPQSEGCTLEMGPGGALVCYIQMPGLTRDEKQAFKQSFSNYGYLESGTTPPIAMWIWDFPSPLNSMDANFDSAIVDQKTIDSFMASEDGQVKNLIQFYLLDRNILQGIKVVGLELESIMLFQATIQKQRSMKYSQSDYFRSLQGMYAYSTDELFQMSRRFEK